MSDFWDAMEQGDGQAIEVHGEEITLAGTPRRGVVEPVATDPRLVLGGESSGVRMRIQVSREVAAGTADSDEVVARGERGRVVGREDDGGSVWLLVGPANRAGRIPGL